MVNHGIHAAQRETYACLITESARVLPDSMFCAELTMCSQVSMLIDVGGCPRFQRTFRERQSLPNRNTVHKRNSLPGRLVGSSSGGYTAINARLYKYSCYLLM